jgi:sulfite reductase (NADPH) flavoprotein alpha-component
VCSSDLGKLTYEPGDWLAVLPQNPAAEVDRLFQLLQGSDREVLSRKVAITRVPAALGQWVLENSVQSGRHEQLGEWLNGDFNTLTNGYSVADFLEQFAQVPLPAGEAIARLKPLQPRLYSIASSPDENPNHVELVVATASHKDRVGGWGKGVASSFLNEQLPLGGELGVYATKTHFKLPENPSTKAIFVGPGTGIAPFRGFLQHRNFLHRKGTQLGQCWLFFGDQHRATDFLLEEELTAYQKTGVLSRLDLAFSRDQDYKIYVQDRIWENRDTIWQWISEGAHIYICGTANPMAQDVRNTFIKIIHQCGCFSEEDSATYVASLQKSRRYLQDVY